MNVFGWSQGGKGRKKGDNDTRALQFVLTHAQQWTTENAAAGTSTLVHMHGSKTAQ